jgi:hypothetical protein
MFNLARSFGPGVGRKRMLDAAKRMDLDGRLGGSYSEHLQLLSRITPSAVPYLWMTEIWNAARVAADEFPFADRVWTHEMFPQRLMYWAHENDLEIVDSIREVLPEATGVISHFYGYDNDGEIHATDVYSIPDGTWFPVTHRVGKLGEPIEAEVSVLAGLLEFLRSPYVGAESVKASRAERRRLSSAQILEPPNIHVVVLRRAGSQEEEDSAESSSAEWSCRWFVRGHWRNQFHPSDESHRPVWIAPYVKGPNDRPLSSPEQQSSQSIVSALRLWRNTKLRHLSDP